MNSRAREGAEQSRAEHQVEDNSPLLKISVGYTFSLLSLIRVIPKADGKAAS